MFTTFQAPQRKESPLLSFPDTCFLSVLQTRSTVAKFIKLSVKSQAPQERRIRKVTGSWLVPSTSLVRHAARVNSTRLLGWAPCQPPSFTRIPGQVSREVTQRSRRCKGVRKQSRERTARGERRQQWKRAATGHQWRQWNTGHTILETTTFIKGKKHV